MHLAQLRHLHAIDGQTLARFVVGGVWIAGAAFNALVTARMDDPYGWIVSESRVGAYRWFFGEIINRQPVAWTFALVTGEAVLGVLTLTRGRKAVLGLVGGTVFSLFLFFMGTPYTVVMGPYALVLWWLAREERGKNGRRKAPSGPLHPGRSARPEAGHLRP